MYIEDPASGRKAKVNEQFELKTSAVTHTSAQDAAEDGRLFQLGSSVVNLTSANESAVLHVKNNEDNDLEIYQFTFQSNAMTGAAAGEMFLLRLYKDSTMTGGTAITPSNNNLGSSKELDAMVEFGAEGATVTGGILAGTALLPASSFTPVSLYWILPKGTSACITVQPATGNTNTNVNIFMDAYISND